MLLATEGYVVPMLSGTSEAIDVNGGAVSVGGSQVIDANFFGSNGVLHKVDAVINL